VSLLIAETSEFPGIFENILKNDKGIYERWLAYADLLLKTFLTGKLRNKYEAKDIIHTLFEKLCSGKRKWDKEKYPNFITFFFMLIKSHIHNLAKFEGKFFEVEEYNEEGEENENKNTSTTMENINSTSLSSILSEANAKELIELSLEKLNGNDDDGIIFLSAKDGSPNRDIAEYLGIDISLVENARKRIKRKLLPLFEKFLERKIK
jgi:RNA polymerase sigma factor (sigma-70 family)